MWLALAGIVMFFAAFTSAYLVMHARNSWQHFDLPHVFWASTLVIIASSVTMHLALRDFRQHQLGRYRGWITVTALLGLVFLVLQAAGFAGLYRQGISLQWNVSAALLYIITGAHMLHVLGGVVALLVMFLRAFRRRVRAYSAVPVEVVATYWHFVGGLWIYLYIFFLWIR